MSVGNPLIGKYTVCPNCGELGYHRGKDGVWCLKCDTFYVLGKDELNSLISETIRKVQMQMQSTPCPHCGGKKWKDGGYLIGTGKMMMLCLGCKKATEFNVTFEVKDDNMQ